jgi:tetratricopeptide (TPR) repeat protein
LATDPYLLDAAIKELFRYSLIERDAERKFLSMHRLVQAVLKDAMPEEVQREWAERAVRAVDRTFPAVEFKTWDRCRRLLTHAQSCADLISQWDIVLPEASSLLGKAGYFLRVHAQYTEAEPLYQRTLAIDEKRLGPDHPDVATRLNNLAALYQAQGRYAEAEPLYQRARAIGAKHALRNQTRSDQDS